MKAFNCFLSNELLKKAVFGNLVN